MTVRRVSYAAIRRRVQVGMRLRISDLRTSEVIDAEITGVDKNGIWWKRLDGEPMSFRLVAVIRPKLNDGKTYWTLASGVTIESADAWVYRYPPLRFEIVAEVPA